MTCKQGLECNIAPTSLIIHHVHRLPIYGLHPICSASILNLLGSLIRRMANHISSPSVEEPHNDIPFSLEGAVDELAAEISEMQDENEATGVDVANLFKTQEKLLWEVSDLDQRVGVLKSYGETVRRRMDGITQRVDQLHFFYEQSKGQSSAQTEQGTKLEERMDNLQKKLQSVLERLDGGTNPEFLLSKGEAQFKGKHPVGRGSEHKEESSRFETQLKIEYASI